MNLKQFVKPEHLKMEGLLLLSSLMQQGDYMVKLDLKDTYLQVPIHPISSIPMSEQDLSVPFSLSTAPRVLLSC